MANLGPSLPKNKAVSVDNLVAHCFQPLHSRHTIFTVDYKFAALLVRAKMRLLSWILATFSIVLVECLLNNSKLWTSYTWTHATILYAPQKWQFQNLECLNFKRSDAFDLHKRSCSCERDCYCLCKFLRVFVSSLFCFCDLIHSC